MPAVVIMGYDTALRGIPAQHRPISLRLACLQSKILPDCSFASRISPLAFLTDDKAAMVSAAISSKKSDFDMSANLGVNFDSPWFDNGPTECATMTLENRPSPSPPQPGADTWIEHGEHGAYTLLHSQTRRSRTARRRWRPACRRRRRART